MKRELVTGKADDVSEQGSVRCKGEACAYFAQSINELAAFQIQKLLCKMQIKMTRSISIIA